MADTGKVEAHGGDDDGDVEDYLDDPINAGLEKGDDLDLDLVLSELFDAILSDDDGMLESLME